MRLLVDNGLAVAIRQGHDLRAESGVSLQMTIELLRVGGSILSQGDLKADAWFPLHIDVTVALSIVNS